MRCPKEHDPGCNLFEELILEMGDPKCSFQNDAAKAVADEKEGPFLTPIDFSRNFDTVMERQAYSLHRAFETGVWRRTAPGLG